MQRCSHGNGGDGVRKNSYCRDPPPPTWPKIGRGTTNSGSHPITDTFEKGRPREFITESCQSTLITKHAYGHVQVLRSRAV